MTLPKNDADKKTEDQYKNTRNALNQDIEALSGKLSPEPSHPSTAAASKKAEADLKGKDLESKPKEPEQKLAGLEAQVQQTRGALSGDVKALSDRLNPEHLKEEAKNMVVEAKDAAIDSALEMKDKVVDSLMEAKDATVQKVVETSEVVADKLHDYKDIAVHAAEDAGDQAMRAGQATWSFARQNALPLAVIGIGASWLIASNRRSSRSVARPVVRTRVDYRGANAYDDDLNDGELDEFVEPRMQSPRRTRSQSAHRPTARMSRSNGGSEASSKIKDTAERIGEEAREVGEKAKDLTHRTGDAMTEAYGRTGNAVRKQAIRSRDYALRQFVRARDGSRELVRDNPLAVGALAMATGIGIGMLLPSTRAENEMYGETRDRLVGEAREAAAGVREAAQNVGDVAKDTVSTLI